MHHGTVDAVRRQVLHGEHLLPEGVLLHLPHRGLLAMRALTLTRRFMRAHDVPLSSGDGAAPLHGRPAPGLRAALCSVCPAFRPIADFYCLS